MKAVSATLALLLVALSASSETFHVVSIDSKGRVQATTTDGRHVQLSSHRRCEDPAISPDHKTVAWIELQTVDVEKGRYHERGIIRWTREGARRYASAEALGIRAFWFVDGGEKLGVSLGPSFGPGMNTLFDAKSGKPLDGYLDISKEPAPAWMDRDGG
jgi:hypothetical protein